MTNTNRPTLPLAEPWMIHPIDFIPDVHLERFDGPMDEHGMPENPDVWMGWDNWCRSYLQCGHHYATGHLTGQAQMSEDALYWLRHHASALRPEPHFAEYREQAEGLFNLGMMRAWDKMWFESDDE